MKTRVYKYGGYYYPQYRQWFFWNYIYSNTGLYDSAEAFKTKEEAVNFLNNGEWLKYKEVVWESK